jgi:hypothetical protein
MFAQYLKERLLEAKQTPTCVRDLPKILKTKDKIEPLGFQIVGLESRQPGVTLVEHFIMPSRIGKCQFQHVLLHPKEKGDHLVKNE